MDKGVLSSPLVMHAVDVHGGARPNFLAVVDRVESRALHRVVREALEVSAQPDSPSNINRCMEWGVGASLLLQLGVSGGEQPQDVEGLGPSNPCPQWAEEIRRAKERGLKRIQYITEEPGELQQGDDNNQETGKETRLGCEPARKRARKIEETEGAEEQQQQQQQYMITTAGVEEAVHPAVLTTLVVVSETGAAATPLPAVVVRSVDTGVAAEEDRTVWPAVLATTATFVEIASEAGPTALSNEATATVSATTAGEEWKGRDATSTSVGWREGAKEHVLQPQHQGSSMELGHTMELLESYRTTDATLRPRGKGGG